MHMKKIKHALKTNSRVFNSCLLKKKKTTFTSFPEDWVLRSPHTVMLEMELPT